MSALVRRRGDSRGSCAVGNQRGAHSQTWNHKMILTTSGPPATSGSTLITCGWHQGACDAVAGPYLDWAGDYAYFHALGLANYLGQFWAADLVVWPTNYDRVPGDPCTVTNVDVVYPGEPNFKFFRVVHKHTRAALSDQGYYTNLFTADLGYWNDWVVGPTVYPEPNSGCFTSRPHTHAGAFAKAVQGSYRDNWTNCPADDSFRYECYNRQEAQAVDIHDWWGNWTFQAQW